METEATLPCSKLVTTGPCREPEESSRHNPPPGFRVHFSTTLTSITYDVSSTWPLFSSRFPTQTQAIHMPPLRKAWPCPYGHLATPLKSNSSSSSLAYGPDGLNSAAFRMIAHANLSSNFFLLLATPIDFRSFAIQYNLNTVFLLFLFCLVSPEILSLRSYHKTFLLDAQPIFLNHLLLKYLVFYIQLVPVPLAARYKA